MFEKGSDVKQGNVAETKHAPQCAFSAENHVQMAREFHDLNLDLGRRPACLTIASNSYTHRYLCKNALLNANLQYFPLAPFARSYRVTDEAFYSQNLGMAHLLPFL